MDAGSQKCHFCEDDILSNHNVVYSIILLILVIISVLYILLEY